MVINEHEKFSLVGRRTLQLTTKDENKKRIIDEKAVRGENVDFSLMD